MTPARSKLGLGAAVACAAVAGVLLALALLPQEGGGAQMTAPTPALRASPRAPQAPLLPAMAPSPPPALPAPDGRASAGAYPRHSGR